MSEAPRHDGLGVVYTGLCLHFEAPADAATTTLRPLDLYAPGVPWTRDD